MPTPPTPPEHILDSSNGIWGVSGASEVDSEISRCRGSVGVVSGLFLIFYEAVGFAHGSVVGFKVEGWCWSRWISLGAQGTVTPAGCPGGPEDAVEIVIDIIIRLAHGS